MLQIYDILIWKDIQIIFRIMQYIPNTHININFYITNDITFSFFIGIGGLGGGKELGVFLP